VRCFFVHFYGLQELELGLTWIELEQYKHK